MTELAESPRWVEVAEPPIVFYDGVCGMCDSFVSFVLAKDRRGLLRVAPLQGETARRMLGEPEPDPAGWSLVLVAEGRTYTKSDAVLETAGWMGLPWSVMRAARLVPRPLRDFVYRFVARRRYRIFGKREACRIPAASEAARFLD
jgi:predicted DCC family thiol-disulfide oxidoreductase YuxK